MEVKLLKSSGIAEFIDDWRLVSAGPNLNIVLGYLNLIEFKDLDFNDLATLNKELFVNIYLESPQKLNVLEAQTIEGTILTKKNASIFLQIISKIIIDLWQLYEKSNHKKVLNIDKDLEEFMFFKRNTRQISGTDQNFIHWTAWGNKLTFEGLSNAINGCGVEYKDLENSNICLSISTKQLSIEKPISDRQNTNLPSGNMSL